MAKASKSAHLLDQAKRGAEVRARFLFEELRLLFSAFPHLKDAFDADELPLPFLMSAGAARPAGPQARTRKPKPPVLEKATGTRPAKYRTARKAAGGD